MGGDLCWKKASSLLAKIFAQETSAGPHSQRSDVFTMTGSSPNGTLLQEQMFRVQKEEKRSHVSHTPDQMLSAALEKNVFCKLRTRWYPLFGNCGRNHGTSYLKTQSTCLKRRTAIMSLHTSTLLWGGDPRLPPNVPKGTKRNKKKTLPNDTNRLRWWEMSPQNTEVSSFYTTSTCQTMLCCWEISIMLTENTERCSKIEGFMSWRY